MSRQTLSDDQALDDIADILSGLTWSPDTLDSVADLVRATGREIADVDDLDFDETREVQE